MLTESEAKLTSDPEVKVPSDPATKMPPDPEAKVDAIVPKKRLEEEPPLER